MRKVALFAAVVLGVIVLGVTLRDRNVDPAEDVRGSVATSSATTPAHGARGREEGSTLPGSVSTGAPVAGAEPSQSGSHSGDIEGPSSPNRSIASASQQNQGDVAPIGAGEAAGAATARPFPLARSGDHIGHPPIS